MDMPVKLQPISNRKPNKNKTTTTATTSAAAEDAAKKNTKKLDKTANPAAAAEPSTSSFNDNASKRFNFNTNRGDSYNVSQLRSFPNNSNRQYNSDYQSRNRYRDRSKFSNNFNDRTSNRNNVRHKFSSRWHKDESYNNFERNDSNREASTSTQKEKVNTPRKQYKYQFVKSPPTLRGRPPKAKQAPVTQKENITRKTASEKKAKQLSTKNNKEPEIQESFDKSAAFTNSKTIVACTNVNATICDTQKATPAVVIDNVETLPETLPEELPDTLLETLPEALPKTPPETFLEALPETLPETQSEIIAKKRIHFSETTTASSQESDVQLDSHLKTPTACNDSDSEVKLPKISLIPLYKLLSNGLQNILNEGDPNTASNSSSGATLPTNLTSPQHISHIASITPNKRFSRPNLVQRTRKISSCSSSSNPAETLVEKVASMDKIDIMNVINSTGTKYDEALTMQARKLLREALRKQLKTLSEEQTKSATSAEFTPDHIVDSINIPDILIDEIRKVYGDGFFEPSDELNKIAAAAAAVSTVAVSAVAPTVVAPTIAAAIATSPTAIAPTAVASNAVTPTTVTATAVAPTSVASTAVAPTAVALKAASSKANTEKIIAAAAQPTELNVASQRSLRNGERSVETTSSTRQTNNLMSRLKTAEQVKGTLEKAPTKDTYKRLTRNSGDYQQGTSPRRQRSRSRTNSLQRSPRQFLPLKSLSPARAYEPERREKKKQRSSKKKPRSKSEHTRTARDVIIIESSSSSESSSSASSDSSTDSSSNSSSSDTDNSARKRRRLKLRSGAHNVVDSFEKLILPNLTQNLNTRYHAKFSTSLGTKLHFISCICTSDYNSKKFQKIDIAKIQKNLKTEDNSLALDFLMREIVNVCNKQKQLAKENQIAKAANKETPAAATATSQKAMSNKNETERNNETNWISAEPQEAATAAASTAAAAAIKLAKTANAAEKVGSAVENSQINAREKFEQINESQTNSIAAPTESAPQSVNENTQMKADVGAAANADTAKVTHENGKIKDTTVAARDCNLNGINKDESINGNRLSRLQSDLMKLYELYGSNNESALTQQRQWKSAGEKKCLDFTNPASIMNFCNFDYAAEITAMSASLTTTPTSFPPVDLDTLKERSLIGEDVLNTLREIDLKLVELHKRKMFFDEMIIKLQKDKMETDLQTIKLQHDKFILLNRTITANATAAALRNANTADTELKTVQKITRKRPAATTRKIYTRVSVKKCKISNVDVNPKDCNTQIVQNNKEQNISSTDVADITDKNQAARTSSPELLVNATNATSPTTLTSSTTPTVQDIEKLDESLTDYSDVPCGRLPGIKSPLTQIHIFENNIIAASEDGNLYKFNLRTLELEAQFAKHCEAITQMYLCRVKKLLYTTSLDGYLKKSAIENFELDLQSLYLQEPLQSIDVKWGVAFIGSRWGNIFTYDTKTNKVAEDLLYTSDASIIAIKATKEGPRKILIVSSKGNIIHFRDALTGLLLRTLDVPEHVHIYSLLLDDNRIYCGTQKKEIYTFDFSTGAHLSTLTCGNGAVSLKLYKNKFLLVGCYDGFIYILDKETGKQMERFAGSGKMVLTLEIVGNRVITSAKDKTMEIIALPDHIIAN